MRIKLLLFVIVLLPLRFIGQSSSSDLLLALQKLKSVGSVLYIAAHPDDENTRLLAYLAKEKKLRTAYLSVTRGDGGQNLIGKEQGEALGVLRTQELLAARRTDGAEQFFTRANDFGYSKNPKETFEFWNKDSILSDMVFIIRRFKPDLIICRFPTTGEGGHGHHTASALLAAEAFEAAADPKRFEWQLQYCTVWQSKALYWNTFNFGSTNTTAPNQIKLDVGTYNPLLGKSYGELASESRSMHKSQGFGVAKQRGANVEYFKFLKGDSATKDLFEKNNFMWSRFNGGKKIEAAIQTCIRQFDALAPEKTVPSLISIYTAIKALDTNEPTLSYWRALKLKECEQLLLGCSGLWLEAFASDYSYVPGQQIAITSQLVKRNASNVQLKGIRYFNQSDTSMRLELTPNELYSFKHLEKTKVTLPYSNPFWLNEKHPAGRYAVPSSAFIGQAENKPALSIQFELSIEGVSILVEKPLQYKYVDPVKGELYRPIELLPPVLIQLSEKVYAFADQKQKTILITVKSNSPNISGKIEAAVFEGWKLELKDPEFDLKQKGDESTHAAILTAGDRASGELNVSITIQGVSYTKSIRRIEYDHIPYQFILSEAEAKLIQVDLKKTDTIIGYLPGAGDDVAACLSQVGYQVTPITDELLSKSDLNKYSAIVTGIRAFNTNNRLPLYHDKLMDYVKNGGNLIVQYNTNSRIGPLQTNIGPYPFTISRDRVTNENAMVNFQSTTHAILNYPNKISSVDFENWVQEKGIYFATDYDKNYNSILGMQDPDEKENKGSLIFCAYGKGNFVYTGLAFFRQLPAGVPGAYRLFANLIALPKNK